MRRVPEFHPCTSVDSVLSFLSSSFQGSGNQSIETPNRRLYSTQIRCSKPCLYR